MATNSELIRVFKDTCTWIDSDRSLTAAVIQSKLSTRVFFENDYPEYEHRYQKSLKIDVTREKSFQAAMRVAREDPGKKIAVMNFANAFVSGGGVTHGSRAQEESLCRTSTLYPVIARPEMWNTYYAHHRKLGDQLATDALISLI